MTRGAWALILTAAVGSLAATAPRIVEGPDPLPGVTPDIRKPGVWIRALDRPDQELADPTAWDQLERIWQEKQWLHDLKKIPESMPAFRIRHWIEGELRYIRRVARYNQHGVAIPEEKIAAWGNAVNLPMLAGSISLFGGFVLEPAEVRALPTAEAATVRPLDLEFDVLSSSRANLNQAVLVAHTSRDNQWRFVITETGFGWLPSKAIGICASRQEWLYYCEQSNWVVTGPEAGFVTPEGSALQQKAFMGAHLIPSALHRGMVLLPLRNTNQLEWILARPEPRQAVSAEARPFTPRAFIEAAFALEGYAYGWGGNSPAGDCSEFLGHVAAACGRRVPRSSSSFMAGLPTQSLPKNIEEKKTRSAVCRAGCLCSIFQGISWCTWGNGTGGFMLFIICTAFINRMKKALISPVSIG
jgi:cell wall-associated NlpC family hydrolase